MTVRQCYGSVERVGVVDNMRRCLSVMKLLRGWMSD